MQKNIESARDGLESLFLQGFKARQTDKKILESACDKLKKVNAEIDKLRPAVIASPDLASRYQELIVERGKLSDIIADIPS